jgi:diguanylate cyclase (GGDEF)-like protein
MVGGRVAAFVIELDRFTAVVDTLGSHGGDDVLRQLARRLRAATSAEDLVARIGPKTFAVLIEGVGPEGCTGMARRLIALLEEPIRYSQRTIVVTCSIGMAQTDDSVNIPEELLRGAETALAAAQRNGRARWASYSKAMRAQSLSRGQLEMELREAVQSGKITAAYEPILGLTPEGTDDVVVGVEVVPQWTRAGGAAVPAHVFMPLAEEIGLGRTLGLSLLDSGLGAFGSWHRTGLTVDRLHLNISQSQLDDPGFARTVRNHLEAATVRAEQLVLEISATDYIDTDQAPLTLAQLHSLGCLIAADGFGRDGLALTALKTMPIGMVKLHHQVTADLVAGVRSSDGDIPSSIVEVCHRLNLTVVADGVQTQDQLRAARDLKVQAAQGQHIARASSAKDVPLQLIR